MVVSSTLSHTVQGVPEMQCPKGTRWVSATEYDAAEKVKAVTAIYDSLGLKAETEAVISTYFDAAFAEIQSLAISADQKSALVKFMSGLVDREV
jgi:geranylgeranyl diphosphate synthase type II